MKVNVFRDYRDTDPKDSSLEEIVRIIREDASIKDRTEKHRYYRSQGLTQAATNEKQSCMCFSVATLFQGGKTQKHITGWPGIGMVDFDDLDENQIDDLVEKTKQNPHTLLVYKTISGKGIRILFLYYGTGAFSNLTDKQQKVIYEEAFKRANIHYRKLLKVMPDPKCKTCTQLSGVAHDPKVFYHPEAKSFLIDKNAVLMYEQERKNNQKQLRRAVKAAQKQLADEGVVFEPGSHNEYVMRMACHATRIPMNMVPESYRKVPNLRITLPMLPWRKSNSSSIRRCRCGSMSSAGNARFAGSLKWMLPGHPPTPFIRGIICLLPTAMKTPYGAA